MALTVAKALKKLEKAKAKHKADKTNADLKAKYKAAKKAHADAVAAEAAAAAAASKKRKASSSSGSDSESEDAPAAKKQKVVTKEDLEAAAAAAKAAYKANKADKSLKAAYKAAKQAVDDFKPAEAAEEAAPTEEAAPAEEAKPADNILSSLKRNGNANAGGLKKNNNNANSAEGTANEKLFIGNLAWSITDEVVREFFKDCGELVDIFWLEDKESGKFKGCGFITFDTLEGAKKAYETKKGLELEGRDITIDYAKARPGGNNRTPKKSPFANKKLSARPDNCTTVFCGNLSFDIDDDKMYEFAKDSGEIKAIRWLTDKNSGDFKGCGFVEFYDSDSVDNFVKKNGEQLLGREIRIDYSTPRS
jgi:nucleolin